MVDRERFEDTCAELNNVVASIFGIASRMVRKHAPEHADPLNHELGRFQRSMAELRSICLKDC